MSTYYKGVKVTVLPYMGKEERRYTKPSVKCNPSTLDENNYSRQQARFEHRAKFVR